MTVSETEAIFGALVPERDCGGCRVCCEHLVVQTSEFSKPAGQMCGHACAAGCGIYETRYPVCRDWFCLWRYLPGLAEEARPDRSGIMWGYAWSDGDHARFRTAYVHGLAFGGLAALERPESQAELGQFLGGELPVWVSEPGGEMIRLYPSEEEARAPEWESGIKVLTP